MNIFCSYQINIELKIFHVEQLFSVGSTEDLNESCMTSISWVAFFGRT